MADLGAKFTEHRRAPRTRLKLLGRFLLSDGGEHPCETIDVSVTGISLRAYMVANLRERVVAYIDELGRLEGAVVRRGSDWFAIEVRIAPSRFERLSQKLVALSGDAKLAQTPARETRMRDGELRTEFGHSFQVGVCDETRSAARVLCNFQLLPGVRVTLDRRTAIVVRATADGFLIDYS